MSRSRAATAASGTVVRLVGYTCSPHDPDRRVMTEMLYRAGCHTVLSDALDSRPALHQLIKQPPPRARLVISDLSEFGRNSMAASRTLLSLLSAQLEVEIIDPDIRLPGVSATLLLDALVRLDRRAVLDATSAASAAGCIAAGQLALKGRAARRSAEYSLGVVIEAFRAEGKSWADIGTRIGRTPAAARRFYFNWRQRADMRILA